MICEKCKKNIFGTMNIKGVDIHIVRHVTRSYKTILLGFAPCDKNVTLEV